MCAGKSNQTLFDRLGGDAALQATLDEFYFRILCDEELLKFLCNTK